MYINKCLFGQHGERSVGVGAAVRISEPTVADGIALVAVRPPVFNMDELRGVRVMVLKGEGDSQLSEGVGHVTAVCLPHTTRSAPTMM